MMFNKREQKKIDKLAKLIDAITEYAEAVGGLRNQLLEQGFSEEAAEGLIIVMFQQNND